MAVVLYDYQRKAVDRLANGKILCGPVGSGKSRTALAYYYEKICGCDLSKAPDGAIPNPVDLYVITTARKRDTLEWEDEYMPFLLERKKLDDKYPIKVVTDSWNNIGKYKEVKDAFFIFDEQRVIGSGAWVKSFLEIAKRNRWILLSGTPGDTWLDYVPVFLANGFYKNRTEFFREHVVFSRFAKYPKVDRYVGITRMIRERDSILVPMDYRKQTVRHYNNEICEWDRDRTSTILYERWNPYENKPVVNAGEMCYLLRRAAGEGSAKADAVMRILNENGCAIVFYNYDWELEQLRNIATKHKICFAEWNGHKHEMIPEGDDWVYFVQYAAGAEGWNCTRTNLMIFYSMNYSWKIMEQAAGRIDRANTPYQDLWYWTLKTKSPIDMAVEQAIKTKKIFNEAAFELASREW